MITNIYSSVSALANWFSDLVVLENTSPYRLTISGFSTVGWGLMITLSWLLGLISVNAMRNHNARLDWGGVIVIIAFEMAIKFQIGTRARNLRFGLIYVSRGLIVRYRWPSVLHSTWIASWLIRFVRRFSCSLGPLVRLLSATQHLDEVIVLLYDKIWILFPDSKAISTYLIFGLRVCSFVNLVSHWSTCCAILKFMLICWHWSPTNVPFFNKGFVFDPIRLWFVLIIIWS